MTELRVGELGQQGGLLRWPSYVLGRLHHQTREVVEQALGAEGLTLREYFVLVHVDDLKGASQQQVADRAAMDRSDLVKVLDRMQARRLVLRERDTVDRRRHVLQLTPSGRDALERGSAASLRATDKAFGLLTPGELATLHRLALKALGDHAAG